MPRQGGAVLKRLRLAGSFCAGILLLGACGRGDLFEAPSRGGAVTPAPAPTESVVTLVASIPHAVLAEVAERKIPKAVPLQGDGHIACAGVPYVNPGHVGSHQECFNKPYLDFRGAGMERVCGNVPDITGPSIGLRNQCADYHWNADLVKDGPLQAGRSGGSLRVGQDVHVTGKAGVGGDLASALSLSGKSFDAKVSARTDVNLALDARWCPIVDVQPVGQWVGSASVEVVGRTCVGIDLGALGHPQVCVGPVDLGLANVLNEQFDKHRDDVRRAAQGIVSCDALRDAVSKQWHTFSIAVDRRERPPLFLNIRPRTAGFSGLLVGDEASRIAVRVGVEAVLSASQAKPEGEPLPALDPLRADQGSLDVNVQAVAPYDLLKGELAIALDGSTFKQHTSAGDIEARVEDVDVYPSRGRLALGLKVSAKVPGRWLDTTGWVYLTGRPVPVAGGRAVSVEDLRYAAVLDNAFWTVAQGLFETQILSALGTRSRFDLGKVIDEAAGEITSAISKAKVPGLKISAGPPVIRLADVVVGSDALVIGAKLSMRVDTEVTAAILQ